MLIATEAHLNTSGQDYVTGKLWRFLPGSRLIEFNPGKPASAKVLTKEFYSACFPKISYDGKHLLFSAQKTKDDPWQIWEMNLHNLKSRRIFSSDENCADPSYLPDGRIVFSRQINNDTVRKAQSLFTCNIDGSDIRQITFSPQSFHAISVLNDGRLITISRQLFPDTTKQILTVMRPDGTKADMFYMGNKGSRLLSGANETSDHKIVFVESYNDKQTGGFVASVSYNRPLFSMTDLTSAVEGEFYYVLPLQRDKYMVSCRLKNSDHFAIYTFDPDKKLLGQKVFSDPDFDIVDFAVAEKRERPKKLPSEVDLQVKTGLLLCQNINLLNPSLSGKVPGSSMIEILGIDTTYGIVKVEEDGSFYLKVMADTPFRIRTIDEKGNTLNGPCSWLWLRPNERRGCAGCHEDPELVPENRVPFAVRKDPIIIPVHISDIKEKKVELE